MTGKRYNIDLKEGVTVTMLVTPSLYGVAERRGIVLGCSDVESRWQLLEMYVRMAYCAAINDWEVRSVDDLSLGEFPYSFADFHDWAWRDVPAFYKAIDFMLTALTGKGVNDYAGTEDKPESKKKASRRSAGSR